MNIKTLLLINILCFNTVCSVLIMNDTKKIWYLSLDCKKDCYKLLPSCKKEISLSEEKDFILFIRHQEDEHFKKIEIPYSRICRISLFGNTYAFIDGVGDFLAEIN